MLAMPSPQPTPSKCEFKDGTKRCRRNGYGAPALCDQHRSSLEAMGWQPPKHGIGEQLGGIVDQMLGGRPPSRTQVEQMVADIASSMLGRPVTLEEIGDVRKGNYTGLRQAAEQFARDRAARVPPPGPRFVDPSLAARIEHAKACGRARAVLGFTATDVITEQILKSRLRELARKHHPDVQGGSTEQMQRVNAAVDLLAKQL